MERVTIIVGTFGDEAWMARGIATAGRIILEHETRNDVPVRAYHGRTLAEARNAAAYEADPGWLCFLDADDDLEPGYLDALLAGSGDLRAPAFRLGYELVDLTGRDIDTINPCVIGTLIRRDLFIDAGGFWHERAWEDWSLFRRAWLLGARIVHHPDAVYHASTEAGSRNNTVTRPLDLLRDIRAAHTAWLATR